MAHTGRTGTTITEVIITPIAFADPPLLNSWGVHEPLALRTVVEVITADGVIGLGEGNGGRRRLEQLQQVAPRLVGRDVFDLAGIEREIAAVLGADHAKDGSVGLSPAATATFAPIEVACLDAQGHATGRQVVDLIGGAHRDRVPYSAYLFYKWAEHPELDGRPAIGDPWGAAVDPEGVVAQARRMIDLHGFGSIKLKAGVFPPEQEIAAIRALAAAFPGLPLRIDPNGAWTPQTGIAVGQALTAELEYLEDPSLGRAGMAEVAAAVTMPLATNMCVIAVDDIAEAFRLGSVGVVLSDHHVWGGLRHSLELAATCQALGWGVSMHSNSHLGISLAAMTHLGAAVPNLAYACDTHYPWNSESDVIVGAPLQFVDGDLAVPEGPGLGIELDRDALARQHRLWLESGRDERDDTTYQRRFEPAYDPRLPRW